MILVSFLPLPLEVLRPLGAPTICPPPRPVRRSTAALFTDMEKFLCKYKKGRGEKGTNSRLSAFLFSVCAWWTPQQMTINGSTGLRHVWHLFWSNQQVRNWFWFYHFIPRWRSNVMTSRPTCSSSVKDTSASGGKGSSCNMGKNSLSCRSIGIWGREIKNRNYGRSKSILSSNIVCIKITWTAYLHQQLPSRRYWPTNLVVLYIKC